MEEPRGAPCSPGGGRLARGWDPEADHSAPGCDSTGEPGSTCDDRRTGAEFEAMMAAGLTVYGMCKSVAMTIVVTDVRLVAKGGDPRNE